MKLNDATRVAYRILYMLHLTKWIEALQYSNIILMNICLSISINKLTTESLYNALFDEFDHTYLYIFGCT